MKLAIIGNPNCGKSTIFSALTGSDQHTGNWPGVTVAKRVGQLSHAGKRFTISDLPGIYSLSSYDLKAQDEKVALQFLKDEPVDLFINVIDSSNFERGLYLTIQLLEMQLPVALILNMSDVAKRKRLDIDAEKLSNLTGLPVIKINAKDPGDILRVKEFISSYKTNLPYFIAYPEPIFQALDAIASQMKGIPKAEWQAIKLLEGESTLIDIPEAARLEAERQTQLLRLKYDEDADMLIMAARYEFIAKMVQQTLTVTGKASKSLSDKIDNIVLNRFLGLPIFLLAMYLIFAFSIIVGSTFQKFFELITASITVGLLGTVLEFLSTPLWLTHMLRDGVGVGIATVFSFIPIIAALYLGLSLLEDSGYMARAAFIIDKYMRRLNLPGKAFVPLMLGFGCNVPAVMSARTLEHERDRITAIMMVPFMSCGARLSVYALFCSVFFVESAQNIVFLLYLTGIAAALLTGLLIRTLIQQPPTYFIMELPNYNRPTLSNILCTTYQRVKGFALGAGKLIVMVFLVLQVISSFASDGDNESLNSHNSVLAYAGRKLTYALAPMGIEEDNWPAAVGLITGTLAKEVVVGTLSALYADTKAESSNKNFAEFLYEALASLTQSTETALDDHAFKKQMLAGFDGKIGAFAYLLFILLYFPCMSVFAVIYKELSLKWAVISACWSTGFAYIVAVAFYQTAKLIV
jgi:ferrous iron transport protein B